MENMMRTIGWYIEQNFATFGLATDGDLVLVEKTNEPLTNGSRKLILDDLRTMGDMSRKAPFDNLIMSDQRGERFQTVLEVECKTRAADPNLVFYWNEARKFRDAVYNALAGTKRGGIVIPRYDWTNESNPVAAGQIWFEVNPEANSPLEDKLEDPDDPANKSIILTYTVRWWRPV